MLCGVKGSRTCDGVGEVLVTGFPQQPDQRGNAVTVLDGDFVVGIFAVGNVLQRPTSCVVDLQQTGLYGAVGCDGAPL